MLCRRWVRSCAEGGLVVEEAVLWLNRCKVLLTSLSPSLLRPSWQQMRHKMLVPFLPPHAHPFYTPTPFLALPILSCICQQLRQHTRHPMCIYCEH